MKRRLIMMKIGRFVCVTVMLGVMIVGVSGCDKKEGTMERTGKEIDKAVEKTDHKIDKAVEKTGEKIEKSGEKIKESVK
jgi:hypothetical protein